MAVPCNIDHSYSPDKYVLFSHLTIAYHKSGHKKRSVSIIPEPDLFIIFALSRLHFLRRNLFQHGF